MSMEIANRTCRINAHIIRVKQRTKGKPNKEYWYYKLKKGAKTIEGFADELGEKLKVMPRSVNIKYKKGSIADYTYISREKRKRVWK